jgi:hypothetical protein
MVMLWATRGQDLPWFHLPLHCDRGLNEQVLSMKLNLLAERSVPGCIGDLTKTELTTPNYPAALIKILLDLE